MESGARSERSATTGANGLVLALTAIGLPGAGFVLPLAEPSADVR